MCFTVAVILWTFQSGRNVPPTCPPSFHSMSLLSRSKQMTDVNKWQASVLWLCVLQVHTINSVSLINEQTGRTQVAYLRAYVFMVN